MYNVTWTACARSIRLCYVTWGMLYAGADLASSPGSQKGVGGKESLHSCQLSRNVRDSPGFRLIISVPHGKLNSLYLSRIPQTSCFICLQTVAYSSIVPSMAWKRTSVACLEVFLWLKKTLADQL